MEHDPRCEGPDDEKLLSDVAECGWHVVKIPEKNETPGWAFSIGLYKNFNHPEIVIFGLDAEVMHSVINAIGEDIRHDRSFAGDGLYPDLIDAYSCTFKPVSQIWYYHFLGYANWFYRGQNYPALQCIWPDKNNFFPWEPEFNPQWVWAQPLLFHDDAENARTVAGCWNRWQSKSCDLEVTAGVSQPEKMNRRRGVLITDYVRARRQARFCPIPSYQTTVLIESFCSSTVKPIEVCVQTIRNF